jgi:twinkle protein
MRVRDLPKFGAAVVEAKKYLGIADNSQSRIKSAAPEAVAPGAEDPSAWKAVADSWAKCQELTPDGPVWNYLVNERKLSPDALTLYKVREFLSRGQWVMVFPYFLPESSEKPAVDLGPQGPAWLKFESLKRVNGKKHEWTTRAPEKTLWGVNAAEHCIFRNAQSLLICEGEKDALSWQTYGAFTWGVVPLSVPFGAKWKGQEKNRPSPNREWLDRCWDFLQDYETIFICTDSDEAGRRAAADIIAEIGPRRCRLVTLPNKPDGTPYKDANDCLKAGVPEEAMRAALDAARDFAPEKVVGAAEYEKEFMDEWFEKSVELGLVLPFEFPFRIRPGELTVWTGIEGSGKTTLLNFVLIGLMQQGERGLVASFEIKPVKTLKKMSRQAFGGLLYDKRFVDKCGDDAQALANYRESAKADALNTLHWLAKNLWIYDHVGIGHWQQLGDDIRWARRRLGITQFVIDNLMRLGIAKDDYPQQAQAITFLVSLAMELDIHIHVVCHQNKSEGGKGGNGGKRTVGGAGEIIANAHNIVEVQRDEKKGEQVSDLFERQKLGTITEGQFNEEMKNLSLKSDGKFILHKQRDGDNQNGSKYLWFLWESQQYVDKPPGHKDHAPIRFVKHLPPPRELPTEEDIPEV